MSYLADLLIDFEKWLKNNRGMHSKQGISKEREKIIAKASEILSEILKEDRNIVKDNESLIESCKNKLAKLNSDDRRKINLLIEYLSEVGTQKHDVEGEKKELPPSEINTKKSNENEDEEQTRIIGRVAITTKSQAKATEFEFWSEDRKDLHIEIGSIVTVKGESDEGEVKIIGMAVDMYTTSAILSPIDDFYSTGYGDPSVELATARPVIKVTKVSVVYRTDGRFEPPMGNWPVFFATSSEITEAYGAEIPDEFAILAGFTWDDTRTAVPIYVDSRFLLGYEGAHLNISGASGLATKTSYALFIIFSAISKTIQSLITGNRSDNVAAVLFNVKEADLMRIDDGPSTIEQLKDLIEQSDKRNMELWNSCIDEGLNPFEIKTRMKFFAPPSPENSKQPLTFRSHEKQTELFHYGLSDLTQHGGVALSSLFDPQDLDEKAVSLISSIVDDINAHTDFKLNPKPNTFKELISVLSLLQSKKSGEWITIGFSTHHTATLSKIINRLSQAVEHQLKGLILQKDGTGKPVPVEKLRPGDVWSIDISKLHSKGQRLVFTQIYDMINRLLEAKRNKEETFRIREREINLKEFPDRVIVFVDELNKFAPSGRFGAELKTHIVDITARGRSIGLSLIGAEQVANQVDEELLSNTSTFAIGRTHAISLKGDAFQWLQGGLKEKAMVLRKGDMILWHAVHSRPIIVSFPKPLHTLE